MMPRDLGAALRAAEFPYGAAVFIPFLRSFAGSFAASDLRRHGYAHLFLHNLQIVSPKTELFKDSRFLIRNPGCVQFSVSSRGVVERLLRKFRVIPIRECLGL